MHNSHTHAWDLETQLLKKKKRKKEKKRELDNCASRSMITHARKTIFINKS